MDKHSKLGIVSFIISVFSIVTFFMTLVLGIVITSGRMEPQSGIAVFSGLIYCFDMVASIVGVGLAIGGFCTQSKHLFCWLGGVMNVLFLIGVMLLLVIGTMVS